MDDRGLTPVLGIVLLLGLTTVVAMSLLLLSATMIGNSQSEAETQQAERSLSEFAQSADRIAQGDVADSAFAIRGSRDGDVRVDDDAGFYEVSIERENGTEVLTNGSLGVYEYAGPDGTQMAFQGGGVWRKGDGAESKLVRPPEFHYRADPEPTLTLPVVRFDDVEEGVPPREGTLSVSDRRDVYPVKPRHANPLQEGTVYLRVRSEYCAGWEEFFAQRTDGSIAEDCDRSADTAPGELLVHLSVPFRFSGLGGDAAVAQTISGNGDVYGSTREGAHDMGSVSGVVDAKVEECADGAGQRLTRDVAGGGLYCAGSMIGDYEVDTEGEDVEIAVDGRVEPDELLVDGDGTVTLFARGDVLRTPADDLGSRSDPETFRLMVHSDYDVGEAPGAGGGRGPGGPGAGNLDLYGLVYAPNSTVAFSGNADIHGAVVADRLHLQSSATEVYHEPSVSTVELEYERGGEPFYYLHVSETTVDLAE